MKYETPPGSGSETPFWPRLGGVLAIVAALIAILGFMTGKFTLHDTVTEVKARLTSSGARQGSGRSSPPEARSETLLRIKAQIEIAVSDYNSTIAAVRAGRAPVEQALDKARTLERDLMYERAEDGLSSLERMTPTDRLQFAQRVPGIQLWYHETQGVEIDPAFFLDLANKYGSEADRQFFSNYRLTFPAGYGWPGYIEQQTDYSGCTKYGSRALSDVYGRWVVFRDRFPGHYVQQATDIYSGVEGEFTRGTCACGDAESVVGEFAAFVARYPGDAIAPRVTQRLNEVIDGTTDIKFNCISG